MLYFTLDENMQGRNYLYANTQVRTEILSNWQNFNTLMRIWEIL